MHRIVRRHPLTDSKFFNRFTCRNDLMHCMDHNGVYGVIFASVCMYLIYNDGKPSLGRTEAERLRTINRRLDAFYKENPGVTSRLDQLQKKKTYCRMRRNYMRPSTARLSKPQPHGKLCQC